MKIVILGSGSKGNSIYIESQGTIILIDCGLSMRQTKVRLESKGIILDRIDGIFITHEHSDHIGSLDMIMKYYHPTLFISKTTYNAANKRFKGELDQYQKVLITKEERYDIGTLSVVPITMSHDVKSCFGFLVKELNIEGNQSFAVATDTGHIKEEYIPLLSLVKILMFESNHDVEMLVNSDRTWDLIQRILSEKGHLSNKESSEYLKNIVSSKTKEVILAHLSEECNLEELAYNSVNDAFKGDIPFKLLIAKQREPLDPIITELIDD